jgi:hypothetical protein
MLLNGDDVSKSVVQPQNRQLIEEEKNQTLDGLENFETDRMFEITESKPISVVMTHGE